MAMLRALFLALLAAALLAGCASTGLDVEGTGHALVGATQPVELSPTLDVTSGPVASKCQQLGFKPGTEWFSNCVALQSASQPSPDIAHDAETTTAVPDLPQVKEQTVAPPSFPTNTLAGPQSPVPLRGAVSGSCDCPYDFKSNGAQCGGSSAWSRPGGKAPACYVHDVQPATPQLYSPGCSESGSCLGDISAATGRPKTVYVGGYYRKNGTYVRGYYRSK